jgi:hypothetical protein
MSEIKDKMSSFYQPNPELGIRERTFLWMCLIAGTFATVVIAPTDLLEHLPLLLSGGVFLFGLAFFAMFWLARHREIYAYRTSSVLVLALLNFAWFFNCGSQGPSALIFFSAAMLFTVLFEGATRIAFLSFFVLNALGLYWLEYSFPHLVNGYGTRLLRLQDLTLTVPCAMAMCVLMMLVVLNAHAAERERLAQSKAELESTLAEMRVLKGLLSVCASCKKIRTEEGDWTQMEVYIEKHSHASFSHGLCPKCLPIYMDANRV